MQQIPIAGPLEVNDGYVLEVFGSGHAFFCKIDMQGRLVWTSDQFPSKASGADMDILPDGKIIATYSTDNGIEGHLCYLILSEQGQILERRALQTTPPTDPGQTYQTTVRKDRRVIAVNPDRFKPGTTPLPAFLLQISWPPVTGDCTEWVSLPETELLSPVGNLQFVPLDTVTTATVMTPIGSTIIMSHEFPTPYREACVDGPETGVIRIDSLLSCTEDWLVDLPGPDYVWTDGHPEYSRLLTESGTYQARNEDCGNVSLYEYILTRENCPCSIYIPTAFSPNNDGYNDLLQCYAGCELSDLRIRIFNRWGVLVFDGLSPAAAWDGTYRGSPSDSGIYIILVNYFWRNEAGTVQQATVSQELTLIR
ncbi:MAG: gliding motility-associated C-terminal domain-containing protein, partial [Lewinella sp.]|nr:gliding motility-associated C-terminal domain-containing protein [Lewinella sp.]